MRLDVILQEYLLSYSYIFLSTAPSEREISLSLIHPSLCSQLRLVINILGRKFNTLRSSREQSRMHFQNPNFTWFFFANILYQFSPSERARSREASYEDVRITILYYHIKVKIPFPLLSAHAQLLGVSVTIYGSILRSVFINFFGFLSLCGLRQQSGRKE